VREKRRLSVAIKQIAEHCTFSPDTPIRVKLLMARHQRGLSQYQLGRIFGVVTSAIAGWECGPNYETSRGRYGWEIPGGFLKLVCAWIQTGKVPTPKEIKEAKAVRSVRVRKTITIFNTLEMPDVNIDPAQLTIEQLRSVYISTIESQISKSNFERKKASLKLFVEQVGIIKVADFTPLRAHAWANQQKWKSTSTCWTDIAHIKAMFNFAIDILRLPPPNPLKKIYPDPIRERSPITPDEFQVLLRSTTYAIPEGQKQAAAVKRPSHFARLRQLMVFIWHTGCRPSEARALKWADIRWGANFIELLLHKTRRRAAVPRIIYLDNVAINLLAWIRNHDYDPSCSHVFRHSKSEPWSKDTLATKLRRIRRKAGLRADLTMYGLRHGFASRAVMAGLDSETVGTLMGHQDFRSTAKYVHLIGQNQFLLKSLQHVNSSEKQGPNGRPEQQA
jgi:integrase